MYCKYFCAQISGQMALSPALMSELEVVSIFQINAFMYILSYTYTCYDMLASLLASHTVGGRL